MHVFFPLHFAIWSLLAGSVLLCIGRWPRSARCLVVMGTVCLCVSSISQCSAPVIRSLESTFPHLVNVRDLEGVAHIVVLGGSYNDDPALTPTSRHTPSELYRVIEGLWLHRRLPQSTLVLSGGGSGETSEAAGMAELLRGLGVAPDRIVIEAGSRNTYEQAVAIRQLIGTTPFLLVTQGLHMPRAVALFRAAGLNPIAAPTSPSRVGDSLWPSVAYLSLFEFALYEHFAMWKERWMGRL